MALLVLGAAGHALLRVGPGRVVRGSALVLAAGAALLALARSTVAAQPGALLLGLGGSGIVLASAALITGPAAARRLSFVNAASSASGVAAPLLLSTLDATTGHGRLAMLAPIPGLLWLAAGRVDVPSTSPAPDGEAAASTARASEVLAAWALLVLAVSAEFAFVVWGASRLVDAGLGPAGAAAGAAAFGVGMAAGRIVGPRVGHRRTLATAGALLAAASAVLVALPVGAAPVVTGVGAAGLGLSVLYPISLARLTGVPGLPRERGAALGSAGSGVAVTFAPIVLSELGERVGLRLAFALLVPVLGAFLALHLGGDRRDHSPT